MKLKDWLLDSPQDEPLTKEEDKPQRLWALFPVFKTSGKKQPHYS